MTTTRWRSSLANIETRIRRGLGIAGPVDLELAEKTILTPVVVVEDLTRAGYASQLRGRRWMVSLQITVGVGAQGSCWILADSPAVTTGTGSRVDTYSGGIQVDYLEMDATSGATDPKEISMWFWATPVIIAPGLPVGGFINTTAYVDPQRAAFEVAPIQTTTSNVIAGNAGGGFMFWRRRMNGLDHHFSTPLNLFLNYNSAISIGNNTLGAQILTMVVTFHGRIF